MFLFCIGNNLPVQAARNRPVSHILVCNQLRSSPGARINTKWRIHWPMVQSSPVQPQRARCHSHHVFHCCQKCDGCRGHRCPKALVHQDSQCGRLYLLDILIAGVRLWHCWSSQKGSGLSNQGILQFIHPGTPSFQYFTAILRDNMLLTDQSSFSIQQICQSCHFWRRSIERNMTQNHNLKSFIGHSHSYSFGKWFLNI